MNDPDIRIQVRAAQEKDLDRLVSLLESLFALERDFAFHPQRQLQGLQRMLVFERARILVAETGGRIMGMCSGQLTVSTAEGGDAMLVEDLVVHPDFRGRGAGRMLLDGLAQWGRERGVSRLQLLADRNNRAALGFYERLGWRTTKLICLRKTAQ
jgi:ribosomal protein S18 acetylase RimI-like enzyme